MQNADAKRRHIRFQCEGEAEIAVNEGGRPLGGTVVDLSREGCLVLLKIEAPPELVESTRVVVTFHLNRQRFQLPGVVRSQRQGTRIGIRFDTVNTKIGSQLGTLTASRTRGWGGRSPAESQPQASESNAVAAVQAAPDATPLGAPATDGLIAEPAGAGTLAAETPAAEASAARSDS